MAAIWADELEKAGKPRMNVVVPGPMATPQRARSHPGEDPATLKPPAEVARALLYLLGPDAGKITGKTIEL